MYKDSLIYFSSTFSTILINFITLPFFTRYLSLSDYGIIALFIIFGSTLTSLLSFGLSQALFRFYFKYDFDRTKILFSSIIFFLLIIFVIGFLFLYPFTNFLNNSLFKSSLSHELILFSFINGCVIYFYNYNKTLLVAEKKAAKVSILLIIQSLLNLMISFYLIYFENFTYMAIIYGVSTSNLIVLVLAFLYNYNFYTIKLSLNEIKVALKYSYPESPGIAIGLLYSSFDKFMLTNVNGLKETGLYDFGFRFATISKLIMDALSQSWNPLFMQNVQEKTNNSLEQLKNKFQELFFIIGFFCIAVSFFTEEALMILTTQEFFAAKYLVPALVIYYFSSTFSFMSVQQIYFSGKLIYNLPVNFFGLLVNLIMNIILIPIYGAFGAVIATITASSIQIALNLYIGNKVCPINYGLKRILYIFAIISSIILLAYPIMFYIDNIIIKFVIKLLIIISFVLIIYFYRLLNFQEIKKEFIKNI